MSWSFIDKTQLDMMWRVYHTDVALVACKNVIQNKLLSLGVMFTMGDKIPTKEFFSHTQRHFIPFCKGFIDAINVQGFAMYSIDSKNKYPTIVSYTVGRIGVRLTESYSMEYGLFISGDEPEKNIFFAREYDVTPDARLTSPISSYYRSRSFCDMVERNAAFVESYRCRPPIYTETTTKASFADDDLLDVGASDDHVRGSLHAGRIQKESYTAHLHEYQTRLSRMLNSHNVDSGSDWFKKKIDPITGLPTFDVGMKEDSKDVQPIIPLPVDSRAVAVPQPQARPDLVAIRQDTVRHACLCMGVPETFLQHHGSHVANVHTALSMLDATLNRGEVYYLVRPGRRLPADLLVSRRRDLHQYSIPGPGETGALQGSLSNGSHDLRGIHEVPYEIL
jgi:hypothetical protein